MCSCSAAGMGRHYVVLDGDGRTYEEIASCRDAA